MVVDNKEDKNAKVLDGGFVLLIIILVKQTAKIIYIKTTLYIVLSAFVSGDR
jgi:hypothetical protein